MNGESGWSVRREGLRYVVERRIWADAFGSGYKWARDAKGFVLRFWRKASAQDHADMLNSGENCRG